MILAPWTILVDPLHYLTNLLELWCTLNVRCSHNFNLHFFIYSRFAMSGAAVPDEAIQSHELMPAVKEICADLDVSLPHFQDSPVRDAR